MHRNWNSCLAFKNWQSTQVQSTCETGLLETSIISAGLSTLERRPITKDSLLHLGSTSLPARNHSLHGLPSRLADILAPMRSSDQWVSSWNLNCLPPTQLNYLDLIRFQQHLKWVNQTTWVEIINLQSWFVIKHFVDLGMRCSTVIKASKFPNAR